MSYQINIQALTPNSLIINWPNQIDEDVHQDLLQFNQTITDRFQHELIETVCTYCSLTLYLKEAVDLKQILDQIKQLYSHKAIHKKAQSTTWHLPVCYDLEFGLDLKTVAHSACLSIEEVVKRHSQNLYQVYFLGFLPGFAYLGGLDSKLYTPRLSHPRAKIPKGSVAIGGEQTGVYPTASPGGWNIIGRTPIELFNIQTEPASFIQAGDKIKFNSISLDEFNKISENPIFDIESLKRD